MKHQQNGVVTEAVTEDVAPHGFTVAMSTDDEMRRIARQQLALIHRDQLRALDLTRAQVMHRVHTGVLERVSPPVFRIGGAPMTPRQLVMAAVLDAGPRAAASHSTAAALWRLPGHRIKPINVTRLEQGNKRPSNLAVVHEPRLLLPEHLCWMGPLRVTTPTRLLFDLAADVHPQRLGRTVDDALVKRLTNARALHEMLALLARRGRSGIGNMREVLADRPPGYRPPESHLEARAQDILRKAGFWTFARQVDIGDDDGWIARVDFLDRAIRLVLQVDSDRWHAGLSDRLHDACQDHRATRAGYTVVRVTETQVWMRPHEVVDAVRVHRLALAS